MQRLVVAQQREGVRDQHAPRGEQPQEVEVVVPVAQSVTEPHAAEPGRRRCRDLGLRGHRHGKQGINPGLGSG